MMDEKFSTIHKAKQKKSIFGIRSKLEEENG